jgi:hypothetical protein
MQLTPTQISAIEAIEGADNTLDPNAERFAQLVYVLNQSAGGSSSGAIADGVDDALFATVADLTNANPLATMIVDANGDQITSFGGSSIKILGDDDATEATVSDLTNSNALHTLLVDENGDQITSFGSSAIAEETTPTPVTDGDPVNPWYDLYGRQVIFGANLSLNALDVNLVNDSITARSGLITNLNAVSANTTGSSEDVSAYHNVTVHTVASSVTTGATVTIEHSLDGTNWAVIDTATISANGTTEVAISDRSLRYIRTAVSSRTDGTYTTLIYAGN